MKTLRARWSCGRAMFLASAVLLCEAKAFAQTTDPAVIPVVTIQATTPVACIYPPNPPAGPVAKLGVFTVFRQGNTNLSLNVYYTIGGTASNGVDYATISQWVTIPAGTVSNNVFIGPLYPGPTNTLTVDLQLAPSPLLTPINYQIGVPSNAVVYIESTQLPPASVTIDFPANGQVFYTPTNVLISAMVGPFATNPFATNVEFFAGTNDLGSGRLEVTEIGAGYYRTGYFLYWTNPPPGNYPLTAVASIYDGTSITSAPVNISVLPGPPPLLPPVVRIITPANGSVFHAPVNVPLYAYATNSESWFNGITSVEFFAGTNSLGFGQRVPILPPIGPGPQPLVIALSPNLFFFIWSNTPVGEYALTAVATDNGGLTATSGVVNITVLPPVPAPTNRPAIVSIVASDPVAIEGTNCWVWPGETNAPPTWANWPAAACRVITNCGPKAATFTVRRIGDTNADLTVAYNIGGTASNGVDYVTLPGSVTIPAGDCDAFVNIVPIDDGPPDINKTVILALTPSTNVPPDYLIGFPPRAAAIIIDNNGPRPVVGMLPGGCFHLASPGPDAAWFCIEYSTDLVNWTPVCTNQVVNGSIDYVDPDAPTNPVRFYRAVPLASGP